jgi:hypothetical protein
MGDYHDYDPSVDVGKIGVEKTVDLLADLLKDVKEK